MKKLNFRSRSKTEFFTQLKPVPAASHVPDWWKSQPPYAIEPDNPDGKRLKVMNGFSNATPKKCVPMLDAITNGYLILLWADVQVTASYSTAESAQITCRTVQPVFQLHGQGHDLPHPPGYDRWVYKYMNCWIPETPPGYSILVTAPAGYRDTPFLPIPAVVDSDKSTLELVFPMWVKSGFSGIVEKGTPLVQLTPFKRESWQSTFNYYEDDEYRTVIEERNFNATIVNHYIKNAWSKKTYK